ncbi:hypothetical protein BHE74_00023085 [Ensete ventricosum]|uniref:Uncharacterized protein n=1 Tax=Ensete ventricosum TaxID=4639 RepID=A0A427AQ89_ENSVE|nr:hypothetical protein B296_00017748 [Ensete ventricosum]RWV84258.1 hypothetical protein GW17_00054039 [Ensete ventricosum]RWW69320.1 hypothetical protein BHE74_00023085 [Ensete ventricosum]RZS10478.1 hypothetical protein BHM03_00041723 [Ensete ventricosum]
MGKQGGGKHRKLENLGKGKITPVQIAFIVDRYLANHHFTATLAAFRSETSDLFAKTKVKEVPFLANLSLPCLLSCRGGIKLG